MKIKSDFVTNSSSCSFTLNSVTSGRFPMIRKSLTGIKFKSKYHLRKNHFLIYNDDYVHCRYKIFENQKVSNEYELGELDIIINKSHDRIITTIYVSINNISNANNKFCEGITREILESILSWCPELEANMVYIQNVIPSGDGGWDGGDSYGKDYEYTYDLFANETKHGVVTINRGDIIFNIEKVGKSLSFLNEAVEVLNKSKNFVCLGAKNNGQNSNSKLVVDKTL